MFKPAATRAKLDGLHFHELRHTFATFALKRPALDMHEVFRAMGHASYTIANKVHVHDFPCDFSVTRVIGQNVWMESRSSTGITRQNKGR